jgi:hypothetical protein
VKGSKARDAANQITPALAVAFADDKLELACRNLEEWRDAGFSSGGSGGGSGHGDPTAVKVLARFERPSSDQVERDYQALPGMLRRLKMDAAAIEKLVLRNTTPTGEAPPEYKVYCAVLACMEEISQDSAEPECPRCRKHRARYGLPYPDKHVMRDGREIVVQVRTA